MNGSSLKSMPNRSDHMLGVLESSVVLIEYGDYENPEVKKHAFLLDNIYQEFRDHVCFIYRHYIDTKKYPHAKLAAVYAEAASLQNGFWEYHHALMHTHDLSSESLFEIARNQDLNLRDFEEDLENPNLVKLVDLSTESALHSRVVMTPTLFINGTRYDGIPTYDRIKSLVEREISDRRLSFLGGQ